MAARTPKSTTAKRGRKPATPEQVALKALLSSKGAKLNTGRGLSRETVENRETFAKVIGKVKADVFAVTGEGSKLDPATLGTVKLVTVPVPHSKLSAIVKHWADANGATVLPMPGAFAIQK